MPIAGTPGVPDTGNYPTGEIGTVTYDREAKYQDDDGGLWTDYMVTNRYESDKHVYMLPIASPEGFAGNSAAFVQLAAPTTLWICEWTVCRARLKPKVPSSAPPRYWVLLDEHLTPAMITVGPDGSTPLYRISGRYVYGATNPSRVRVSHPLPPWLANTFNRSVDNNQFITGISVPEQQLNLQQSISTGS